MRIEQGNTLEELESVNIIFNDNQEIKNFNTYLSITNIKSERWDDFLTSRDSWMSPLKLNVAEGKGNGRVELVEAVREFIKNKL